MKPTYTLAFALALCCATATRVQSQQPDLQLAVPNVAWEDAFWGNIHPFQFNLLNQGNAAALGGFTIKSYLSLDELRSPDDVQDGIITTGNLLAGQSVNNVQGALTIPPVPEGWYHLLLEVDADGQIAESNEDNNVVVAGYLRIQNPDKPNLTCAIDFVNLNNVNALQVVAQANNLSAWPVQDSFDLVVYKGSNGQPLDQVRLGPLPPGGNASHTFNLLLAPQDLSGFMFDFVVAADLTDSINELNEDDNYTFYAISVPNGLLLPDYALALSAPPNLNGETLEFQYTVTNTGGGTTPASTMSMAMRKDSSFNWFARYPLGVVSFPALAAGQSHTQTLTVALPPNPITGHYFLELIAGDDLNNANNRRLEPFDVVSPYIQPERLFLGEGQAVRVRQNNDLSYTVLIKVPADTAQATAAKVSPQGVLLNTVGLGEWGIHTAFAPNGYISVGQPNFGQLALVLRDEQGNISWEKSHNIAQAVPECVTPTLDGGFLIGGSVVTNNPVGPPSYLPFLLRTDAQGNEIWRRTTGPLAGMVSKLEALSNGTFAAALRYNGFFEQKYGVEICRITADGTQYQILESDLATYQGAFLMSVNAIKSGLDTTVYFARNHWDAGKWTNYLQAYFGQSPGWRNEEMGCQGVCVPTGMASADAVVPTSEGGMLVGGTFGSDYHGYHIQRLDAQGAVVWRRPYPDGVSDGVQTASGGFALCGNTGPVAYLTWIDANGTPELSGNCLNDLEAPQLLGCPVRDTVVTTAPNVYVSWVDPTVIDNCGAAALSSSQMPGYFAVGEHTVLFTATDAQNNTATCTYAVSVQQVPCLVNSANVFCSDNQTPDLPEDDQLILSVYLTSPDALTWSGTFDVPGLDPVNAPFNATYEQIFAFSGVAPYILDGQLSLHVLGQNGNQCDQTLVFDFDSTDYCARLVALPDIKADSLFLLTDTLEAGMPFAFGYGLRNKGNWPTSDAIGLEIRVAKDTVLSVNDWVVSSAYDAVLPANDSLHLGDIVLQTSTGLPEGLYWLWLIADKTAQIAEWDETNNTVKVPIYVTQPVGTHRLSPEPPRFVLSPNPATAFATLQCPAELWAEAAEFRLYDSRGRVIWETADKVAAQVPIPLDQWPEGMYMVEIRHSRGVWAGRMLKKRT